jgi:hypothetical protein
VGLQVFCFVIVELRCKKLGEFQGVVKFRVSFSNSIANSLRKSVRKKIDEVFSWCLGMYEWGGNLN